MKPSSAKRSLSSILIKGIGFIIMGFILSRVNFGKIYALFSGIHLRYLIAGLILLFPVQLFKTLRWNMILRETGIVYPLGKTLAIYWIGIFWGTLTPAKAGDLVKLIYLKADGEPLADGLASIILDRLADLGTVVIVAVFASLFFLPWSSTLRIGIIVVLLFFGAYLFFFTGLAWRFGSKLLSRGAAAKIGIQFGELKGSICKAAKRLFFPLVLLSCLSWAIGFATAYCLARALGLNIPYFTICAITSLSSLIALLPVSVSGIGTRDGTIIILFGRIGISVEAALAFSLLYLFFIIVNAFVGFLIYLSRLVPVPSLGYMRGKLADYFSTDEKT